MLSESKQPLTMSRLCALGSPVPLPLHITSSYVWNVSITDYNVIKCVNVRGNLQWYELFSNFRENLSM
jgi:hypothetical protein